MKRARPILMAVSLVSVVSAGCSAPLLKLPPGPGALAPDGRMAIDDATAVCRRVSTITVEIAVSGSIGGHRTRARLSAGLARPDSARIEAGGPVWGPVFIFCFAQKKKGRFFPPGRPGVRTARA